MSQRFINADGSNFFISTSIEKIKQKVRLCISMMAALLFQKFQGKSTNLKHIHQTNIGKIEKEIIIFFMHII